MPPKQMNFVVLNFAFIVLENQNQILVVAFTAIKIYISTYQKYVVMAYFWNIHFTAAPVLYCTVQSIDNMRILLWKSLDNFATHAVGGGG
jgi:hypothetical protein